MFGQMELQARTSENLIFCETTNKTNNIRPITIGNQQDAIILLYLL